MAKGATAIAFSAGTASVWREMETEIRFQETRQSAQADILGIFSIRKFRRVMPDVLLIIWILSHAGNTLNVIEDSLTETIIADNVLELWAVDCR